MKSARWAKRSAYPKRWFGGNRFRVDMPRLLELWRQGRLKLDTLISGKIKLDEINEGFTMLKSGAPVRNLIDFGVV